MVAYAAVSADGRKFASAVHAPEFPIREEWAQRHPMSYCSRQQPIEPPKVPESYEGIVAEVNKKLTHFETIKNFRLVPDEFTIAGGQLAASMKMPRRGTIN